MLDGGAVEDAGRCGGGIGRGSGGVSGGRPQDGGQASGSPGAAAGRCPGDGYRHEYREIKKRGIRLRAGGAERDHSPSEGKGSCESDYRDQYADRPGDAEGVRSGHGERSGFHKDGNRMDTRGRQHRAHTKDQGALRGPDPDQGGRRNPHAGGIYEAGRNGRGTHGDQHAVRR